LLSFITSLLRISYATRQANDFAGIPVTVGYTARYIFNADCFVLIDRSTKGGFMGGVADKVKQFLQMSLGNPIALSNTSENSETTELSETSEDSENTESGEKGANSESSETTESSEGSETSETSESSENSEDSEASQVIQQLIDLEAPADEWVSIVEQVGVVLTPPVANLQQVALTNLQQPQQQVAIVPTPPVVNPEQEK
jgi:hypothetical protein